MTKLAAIRIQYTAERLKLSQKFREKIYFLFQRILTQRPSLFFNRHIDQIIICCFYAVVKVCVDCAKRSTICFWFTLLILSSCLLCRYLKWSWLLNKSLTIIGSNHIADLNFFFLCPAITRYIYLFTYIFFFLNHLLQEVQVLWLCWDRKMGDKTLGSLHFTTKFLFQVSSLCWTFSMQNHQNKFPRKILVCLLLTFPLPFFLVDCHYLVLLGKNICWNAQFCFAALDDFPSLHQMSPFPSLPDFSPKKLSPSQNVYLSPLRPSKASDFLHFETFIYSFSYISQSGCKTF